MYVLKPSEKKLTLLKQFFKEMADKQKDSGREYGIIEFTYDDLINYRENIVRSQSYASGILNWLRQEGYLKRIRTGRAGKPSLWDVRNLLNGTKEAVSVSPLKAKKEEKSPKEKPNVQLQVLKKEKEKQEPVEKEVQVPLVPNNYENPTDHNREILNLIHQEIRSMIHFIQQLPNEMIGHLERLASKLQSVDSGQYEELQKENEQLIQEIHRLKKRVQYLMEQANVSYNRHKIYRLRNMVLDEVERMLIEPSWKLKQSGDYYRKYIQKNLDEIMDELGIFEDQPVK